MIVSHAHQFIFIKTLKTAGTSIEVFLSQVCGEQDIVTPILPHVEPHVARNHNSFYNHMPSVEVRKKVGRSVWDSYLKFCVERNPWDKTLSYYHMQNHRQGGTLSLDAMIDARDFPINYPSYEDADGTLIVDRVLRYERLADDLSDVFATLRIPFNGSLRVNAKSEPRTDRRPYQQVYTPEQANAVAKAFSREIEIHGYQF